MAMTNDMFGIEPPRWHEIISSGEAAAPKGRLVAAQGVAQWSPGFACTTMVSPERAVQYVVEYRRPVSAAFADIHCDANGGFDLRDEWVAPSGLVFWFRRLPRAGALGFNRTPRWGWVRRSRCVDGGGERVVKPGWRADERVRW